ncbi:MAG TPA: hypothetical protein VFX15_00995, partial [Actinomycetes bacterium]|nr:hypothetical protein [Actinomycetes bacterium]
MVPTTGWFTRSRATVSSLVLGVLVAPLALFVPADAASASPAPPPGVPDGLTKCTRAYAAWCGSLEVPLDRTGKTAGTVTIDFQYFP